MNVISAIFRFLKSLWQADSETETQATHAGPSEHNSLSHAPLRETSSTSNRFFTKGSTSDQVNDKQHVRLNLQHDPQTIIIFCSHAMNDEATPISTPHPLSLCSSSNQVVHVDETSQSVRNNDIEERSPSSDYIRNAGKHILPQAFMKETWDHKY